jgi:hypothetical protein
MILLWWVFFRFLYDDTKPSVGALDLRLGKKDVHILWNDDQKMAWINSDFNIRKNSELISIFNKYGLKYLGITQNLYFNGFSINSDADIIRTIDLLW